MTRSIEEEKRGRQGSHFIGTDLSCLIRWYTHIISESSVFLVVPFTAGASLFFLQNLSLQ
ncbi:hypothetical protein RhiirB3_524468 [Rhizophagus irregularis]|nr:hypothetical protein RhiirB3_524468 [Rhizophagus irregularis]